MNLTRKKVLIITYYWPPSGGSGVQRWVKFVKYLRDFDIEPIIYAPEDAEYPATDPSLFNDLPENLEVLKQPIWEPYSFYKKWMGMKEDSTLGTGLMKENESGDWKHKLSLWIRGNLFIPDARRFWIRPSVRFLNAYLKDHPVDAIVSTGPPHSMHMIAKGVKEKTGLPWLADFRDPWTNIDFFEDLQLSDFARKKHHRLEQEVLNAADMITVVSPTMKKEYEAQSDTEIRLITNGFDHSDFPSVDYRKGQKFTVSHVGMMSATRNPQVLWEAIQELNRENEAFAEDLHLQLIGKVDASIRTSIRNFGLNSQVEISSYIPHSEIIKVQQQSGALLLIINDAPNANLILPGKLFEYMAANRPIICLSPVEGDVKEVIEPLESAQFLLYNEKDALKKELLRLYKNWKDDDQSVSKGSIEQYSRRSLTQDLSEALNSLIS